MRRIKAKPRIALLGMGILGGGPFGQGIPVLKDLFNRLSDQYDITFYSFKPVHRINVPSAIHLRQTVSWNFLPERIKFLLVPVMMVWDQIFNPCDLIFSVSVYPTGQWAVTLGKLFRRPVIVQIIAFETVEVSNFLQGDLTKPGLRKITEYVCEKSTALVAVAEYQKKITHESLPTTRKIDVLPLRIDPQKFPYLAKDISSRVEFIHVGYYSVVKDQDTMFLAFAKVAQVVNCHLTVIGKGYDDPKVSKMIQDLKIADKTTFAGLVSQYDLPKYYHNAHIMLHTARYETGCAVIQEAMASGVVVCGTNVGLLSDIGEKYAAIVQPGDIQQLAEKILQLVKDPIYYRKLREEAYQWITTYDSIWSYNNYHQFIELMRSETYRSIL